MIAIGFLLALMLLDALALFFGMDSTEKPRSKEEELAAFGVTWKDFYSEGKVDSAGEPLGKKPTAHPGSQPKTDQSKTAFASPSNRRNA